MQLTDEEIDRPEIGAALRIVRAAAVAELVVVDHGAAVRQVGEGEEVVVSRSWAAVEDDERRGLSGIAGTQVADDPVPRLRVLAGERKGDYALAHVHGRDSTPRADGLEASPAKPTTPGPKTPGRRLRRPG